MNLVKLDITALIPTRAGCAIFLSDGEKIIQFYIENNIGQAINDHISGESYDRPVTYDMVTSLLSSLGAQMKSLIIADHQAEEGEDGVYFVNMVWEMENEVQGRKIVELDCRPSDAIALAVRQDVAIMIRSEVWGRLEDKSQLLHDLKSQMGDGTISP